MSSRSVIIAGTQSGVGKTTVSIGIMAALNGRGLAVQPFKVGPDFIDPAYHNFVTGRISRNLDGWMMGKSAVRGLYARTGGDADISVVEGVMGLFDGIGRGGMEGSTAEVARLTGAPVVLVVDARSMAGSAAAIVKGFESLDPEVNVAGVILNRVGSGRHESLLRDAIKRRCRAAVIGAIPRDAGLDIPSRHLGLTTDVAGILTKKYLKNLKALIEKSIDIDELMRIAKRAKRADAPAGKILSPKSTPLPRLAVAMDEAFCFYYRDNLELLESYGLEIVPFSPLKDDRLPEGIGGIYLGGGYPEMYARGLSMNDFVKRAVVEAVSAGMPVYAECGGFMYLTEGITDMEGVYHPMTGVFPVRARMLKERKALGYREVSIMDGCPLFPLGGKARGHEFHYSEITEMPGRVKRAYSMCRAVDKKEAREGYVTGNVLGSYVHLHFYSNTRFARSFARAVSRFHSPAFPAGGPAPSGTRS